MFNKEKFAAIFPLFFLVLLALFLKTSCLYRVKIKDPYYESFFEKARIIMTEDELKIYKRLTDNRAKKEFIEYFWKIRDPDLSTEENEAKEAFDERVEYANRWFGKHNPHRGIELHESHERSQGWASDRGKIYIILGPPDELIYDGTSFIFGERRRSQAEARSSEQWYYYYHRFMVAFVKTNDGRWVLANVGAALLEVLDMAKLNIVTSVYKDEVERRLTFKANYEKGRIIITIPMKRISYKENEDKIQAEFKIWVSVYLDHRPLGSFEETRSFDFNIDQLDAKKTAIIEIPYQPPQKGKYLFDVVVEDLLALSFSKYRSIASHIKRK